jgi:hypothetical protein
MAIPIPDIIPIFPAMFPFVGQTHKDEGHIIKQPFHSAWCVPTCLDLTMAYALYKFFFTEKNLSLIEKMINGYECFFIQNPELDRGIKGDGNTYKSFVNMLTYGFNFKNWYYPDYPKPAPIPPHPEAALPPPNLYFPRPAFFDNSKLIDKSATGVAAEMSRLLNIMNGLSGIRDSKSFYVTIVQADSTSTGSPGLTDLLQHICAENNTQPSYTANTLLVQYKVAKGGKTYPNGLNHQTIVCGFNPTTEIICVYDPELCWGWDIEK